ncbi:DUF6931 family protein [Lichenicola sp.]|uniref:DUF6931 family protein n=1 Tax=Lichenicola sp. TaxID=2804529 RepID=UPI003B00BBE1
MSDLSRSSSLPLSDRAPVPHKLRQMPAAWLQQRLKLVPASPMLRDRPSSLVLLDRLERAAETDAALCLSAHALPPREAVWWACMCARSTAPAAALDADSAAGHAAEDWVRSPGDAARARAYRLAHQAKFQSPEAMAAMAAFWTGAADAMPVTAETARAQQGRSVENAVRMAAVRGPVHARALRVHAFLQSARDIAAGGAGRIGAGSGAGPGPGSGAETEN